MVGQLSLRTLLSDHMYRKDREQKVKRENYIMRIKVQNLQME